nr:uncharacterized protein [uncultured bacterium]
MLKKSIHGLFQLEKAKCDFAFSHAIKEIKRLFDCGGPSLARTACFINRLLTGSGKIYGVKLLGG